MNISSFQLITQTKWFRGAVATTILQQALVATGTFLMGNLAKNLTDGDVNSLTLALLIISIAIPGTLIHYGISLLATRAIKQTLLSYIQSYISATANVPQAWRDSKLRENRQSVMTRTGQETIQSTTEFLIDSVATVLNIAFNTISIILVTNYSLGFAILIGASTGMLIVHWADTRISRSAAEQIQSETNLHTHLEQSWDNVTLGNRSHFTCWMDRFNRLFNHSVLAALGVCRSRDRAVALAGLATNLVVLISIGLMIWNSRNNLGAVAALLIMLPRSLQIVMHLQIIQTYWARWKELRQKLQIVDQTITAVDRDTHQIGSIDLSRIQILDTRSNKLVDKSTINQTQTTRLRIQGPNGSGKSTLLLELKGNLGADATYIPSQHNLHYPSVSGDSSTGEKAMDHLDYLLESTSGPLLLDEWDANLSEVNRGTLDRKLDQASQSRLIIEVVHGRS